MSRQDARALIRRRDGGDLGQVTAVAKGRRGESGIFFEGRVNMLSCWINMGSEKKTEVEPASRASGLRSGRKAVPSAERMTESRADLGRKISTLV